MNEQTTAGPSALNLRRFHQKPHPALAAPTVDVQAKIGFALKVALRDDRASNPGCRSGRYRG
jgi:hypothetical protein